MLYQQGHRTVQAWRQRQPKRELWSCQVLVKIRSKKLMYCDQIGKVGELEEVDEYRVEIMCLGRDTAVKAVEALKE